MEKFAFQKNSNKSLINCCFNISMKCFKGYMIFIGYSDILYNLDLQQNREQIYKIYCILKFLLIFIEPKVLL